MALGLAVAGPAHSSLWAAVAPEAFQETADFGDAPDGGPTAYGLGTPTGSFPSLLGNDGARHASTSFEWLGDVVDVEADSRQVDQDVFDDGASVGLTPCGTSTLTEIDRRVQRELC